MTPPKCHVLCVDDNDDTCFMLTTLLRHEGCEVSSADTVAGAKRLLSGTHFDLTILDNRLPDGSGIDLCRWARGQVPHTPVIFYTGAAFENAKGEAVGAGAAAFVTKPDIKGLLAAVTGLLRKKSGASVS